MWSSRDITLVIILAVVALIYSALMIQIPRFITGIPGLGYFTGFGIVIILNIAFLLFEGRRWRFFFVVALERIILSAIFVHMRPLLFLRTVPLLTGKFIQDVFFNSVYSFFEKRNQLKWFSIILSVVGAIIDPFLRIMMYPLIMPPEYTTISISLITMIFPVLIFNGVLAGYIAFKIYNRIKKPSIIGNDLTIQKD